MIILSKTASIDIQNAHSYTTTESPKAARKLIEDIDLAFSIIAQFPSIGHERLDLTAHKVRFYRIQKYLVIYQINRFGQIEVVRFLHGYQNLVELLS